MWIFKKKKLQQLGVDYFRWDCPYCDNGWILYKVKDNKFFQLQRDHLQKHRGEKLNVKVPQNLLEVT